MGAFQRAANSSWKYLISHFAYYHKSVNAALTPYEPENFSSNKFSDWENFVRVAYKVVG